MDLRPIRAVWNDLAGRRVELVQTFYDRLFERYPQYRSLFPERLEPQLEKMVEMFTSVARFADHVDLIRPYLMNVGFAHRRTGITASDVENFKETFLEALADVSNVWDEACERAWRDAFDDMIVPLFDEGLDTGRRQRLERDDPD